MSDVGTKFVELVNRYEAVLKLCLKWNWKPFINQLRNNLSSKQISHVVDLKDEMRFQDVVRLCADKSFYCEFFDALKPWAGKPYKNMEIEVREFLRGLNQPERHSCNENVYAHGDTPNAQVRMEVDEGEHENSVKISEYGGTTGTVRRTYFETNKQSMQSSLVTSKKRSGSEYTGASGYKAKRQVSSVPQYEPQTGLKFSKKPRPPSSRTLEGDGISLNTLNIGEDDYAQDVCEILKSSNPKKVYISDGLEIDRAKMTDVLNATAENQDLESLSIEGIDYLEEIMEVLTSSLKNMRKLKRLTIKRVNLSPNSWKLLCCALKDSHPRIEAISLEQNKISDTEVAHISQCVNQLLNLKNLSLSYNQITDEGAKKLASLNQYGRSPCFVDLSSNQIGTTGADELLRKWTTMGFQDANHKFNFDGNQIVMRDVVLEGHKSSGSMNENSCGTKRVNILIQRMRNETFLTINLNRTQLEDDDVITLINSVGESLEILEIEGNNLTHKIIPYIAELCHRCHDLKRVNIANNRDIPLYLVELLGNGLINAGSHEPFWLREDTFKFCYDDETGGFWLEDIDLQPWDIPCCFYLLKDKPLRTMSFVQCNLTGCDLRTIFHQAGRCKTESVFFNTCMMDDGARVMEGEIDRIVKYQGSETVSKSSRLVVKHNSMGIGSLVKVLVYNKNLTFIDLSENNFGIEDCKILCEHLAKDNQIVDLNISGNGIGDKGVKYLAYCLQSNTNLRSVNIANNGIGNKGINHLGKSLMTNHNLTFLDVTNNSIGVSNSFESDCMPFFKGLSKNITLSTLKLRNNKLSDDFVKDMSKYLPGTTKLKKLDFSVNDLSEKGLEMIVNMLGSMEITHVDISQQKKINVPAHMASEPSTSRGTELNIKLICAYIKEERTSLSFLGIRGLGVSEVDAVEIAQSLSKKSQQSVLDLSGNFLGKKTQRQLVKIRIECNCPRSIFTNDSGTEDFFDSPV